ncbi:MAG: PorT family protein, partial [Chitinophagaceae bacterium]
MKKVIFTLTATLFTAGLFAQTKKDTVITTTTTVITTTKDTVITTDTAGKSKKKKMSFSWNGKRDSSVASKKPGFSAGITFSRIDVGFATLVDNGSFTLSPENNFLRYRSWKSSNFGFDLGQMGYRFNSSFKIYVSAGFDWTSFRLREDVTILKGQPSLT